MKSQAQSPVFDAKLFLPVNEGTSSIILPCSNAAAVTEKYLPDEKRSKATTHQWKLSLPWTHGLLLSTTPICKSQSQIHGFIRTCPPKTNSRGSIMWHLLSNAHKPWQTHSFLATLKTFTYASHLSQTTAGKNSDFLLKTQLSFYFKSLPGNVLSSKCYTIRGLNSLEGNTDFYNRKKYCNANMKHHIHSEDIFHTSSSQWKRTMKLKLENTNKIQLNNKPLHSTKVKMTVTQSCPTLQARILEWVAYPFSSGSSRPKNRTRVSCISSRFFTNWAIREALIDF